MKTNRFFYFLCCVLFIGITACHLDKKPTPTTPITPITPKPTTPVVKKHLLWAGAVSIVNGSKYRNLLRGQRRCDPCTNYRGPLECKNFDDQAELEITLVSNDDLPAKATLKLHPIHDGKDRLDLYGYIGACVVPVPPLTPIEYKGTAKWIEDYDGFHIRFESVGEARGISYLIMRSEDTNPVEDGLLDVELFYGGSTAAGARFGTAELENSDPVSAGVEAVIHSGGR